MIHAVGENCLDERQLFTCGRMVEVESFHVEQKLRAALEDATARCEYA